MVDAEGAVEEHSTEWFLKVIQIVVEFVLQCLVKLTSVIFVEYLSVVADLSRSEE